MKKGTKILLIMIIFLMILYCIMVFTDMNRLKQLKNQSLQLKMDIWVV